MSKSELGKIGEDIACEYLVQNNFQIIERNFREPWGEIDIITKAPDKTLVFVEVKTMREYVGGLGPENQMTRDKLRKFKRMASLYAGSREDLVNDKKGWRLDLVTAVLKKKNLNLTNTKNHFIIKHYRNIF